MAPVHVLTLLVVFVAILVVAVWLMAVTYHLYQVSTRLNTILADVVATAEKTAPLDAVVSEIAKDLAAGHEAIDGAVERLKQRKGFEDEPAHGAGRPPQHAAGQPAPGAVPAGPPPITFTNY